MKQKLTIRSYKFKINLLVYLLIFVLCYGVCNANIFNESLMPFGVGVIFALISLNLNGYILAVIYMVAYSLAGSSVSAIIIALNVSLCLCVLQYLISIKKVKVKKWLIFVFAGLSQIAFILLNLGGAKTNLALMISVIVSMLFLYSAICFVDATYGRGFYIKLNLDEKICGGIILIIFMLGLSNTSIYSINLGLIFASLIILICTFGLSCEKQMIISILIGIAFACKSMSAVDISMFVIMSLMALCFKCNFKYLSMIAIVLGYIAFNLFFCVGLVYGQIISLIIGAIIFAFIPMKLINKINGLVDKKPIIFANNIIKNAKSQIINRITELSKIFGEMTDVYKNMVHGNLNENQSKELLREELISSVCSKCPNQDFCFRSNGNFIDNSIDTILNSAYEKGRILLVDLPQHLSTNCININKLLNTLNSLISAYKDYTGAISNLDSSRLLIASQLSGVSSLLATLSSEVDLSINFDPKFASVIKEELMYKNVMCLDLTIYEKDAFAKFVNLIIKTKSINKDIIEKVVSKVLNKKYKIKSIEPSEVIDASLVTMVTRPNYDIAYGSQTITKSGKIISGDTNSIVDVDDGKFMVSICDGMGSGKNANDISKLTTTLIEKFYKAGFENEIILSSVNKLLSLNEKENFSTIDLCVIDTIKNTYDFIKLGATVGFLKRDKGECETISSSGLPIGVLEEIKPHITKKLISPFDMLVFVSDGITDAFENKLDLAEFIRCQNIINPTTLSKVIAEKALELNGGIAKDDMTVICVRVFENV